MNTLVLPAVQSKGQMEDAVSAAITKFEKEFKGRGPNETKTHIVGDMILIRMKGILSLAEKHLLEDGNVIVGRDLVKHLREVLIEKGRRQIEKIIKDIAGRSVVSLYADISTVADERVVVLTLDKEVTFPH